MATTARSPSTFALCIAGALSLAVAMGIGRFAFTPVLPLMIREGQLDVAAGGHVELALADHQRQYRRERKAANAHRDRQRQRAGDAQREGRWWAGGGCHGCAVDRESTLPTNE